MKLQKQDQFQGLFDANNIFDAEKLRLTLIALSDKIDTQHRLIIEKTYNDDKIHSIYRGIRNSGIYDHGGKSKVHRKIISFPNAIVADFVNKCMTDIYGPDWLKNKKALKHDLVRPWHVVSKI